MSPSHQWFGPDLDVLQATAGIRRGAEGEVEAEDAHRREHLAVVGLGRHARRADVGGNAGADRLPARGGALVDVHLRVRPPTPTTETTWVALPTDCANHGATSARATGAVANDTRSPIAKSTVGARPQRSTGRVLRVK